MFVYRTVSETFSVK